MQEGLPGMYLHKMKDGKINMQGQVLFVCGDWAMVQLYSFLDGSDTYCVMWDIDDLAEDCRFYHYSADWNAAAGK